MVISIDNAEHYSWGQQCDGWHLLNTDGLSVIQERMPPGTAESLHYHQQAQQLFYMLSGVATLQVDGETQMVQPGESLHIPANVPHRIFNNTDTDLSFLVISSPKSHGDRINI